MVILQKIGLLIFQLKYHAKIAVQNGVNLLIYLNMIFLNNNASHIYNYLITDFISFIKVMISFEGFNGYSSP